MQTERDTAQREDIEKKEHKWKKIKETIVFQMTFIQAKCLIFQKLVSRMDRKRPLTMVMDNLFASASLSNNNCAFITWSVKTRLWKCFVTEAICVVCFFFFFIRFIVIWQKFPNIWQSVSLLVSVRMRALIPIKLVFFFFINMKNARKNVAKIWKIHKKRWHWNESNALA